MLINYRYRWLIGAIALTLAAIYFVFVFEFHYVDWKLSRVVSSNSPTPTVTDKSINFNHIGNFQMSDPKLRHDEFYLIYEAPGAPALTARLYFNDKTICQDYSGESICPEPVFGNGAKIQVLGTKINNYVIVKRIIIP